MMFDKRAATVALNLRPRRGSWGGANQWASQLARFLDFTGWRVRFDLRRPVDAVIMTHTGMTAHTSFGWEEVGELKARHPRVRCIHRINDNDIRKSSDGMDALLEQSNKVADHTVFVSAWLRDHHAAGWFDPRLPHSVISPGADPSVFHPIGQIPWTEGAPFRFVTHHWSDNMAKGFDVYEAIDTAIAEGRLPDVELWIVGRWPAGIRWRAARTFAPVSGRELASLLRQCHGYVSASRFEPGAMHPVEGIQCGLPLLYHRDTGGTVETGRRYGVVIGDDIAASVGEMRRRYAELREAVLLDPPSGDLMALSYRRLLQSILSVPVGTTFV
jgi:glycosyltransferase involved in cell wall biosynthesis